MIYCKDAIDAVDEEKLLIMEQEDPILVESKLKRRIMIIINFKILSNCCPRLKVSKQCILYSNKPLIGY